jgi:hypothetical protein
VLIYELVIGPGPEAIPAALLGVEMLAGIGGRERTETESAELPADAGLYLHRIIPTHVGISLLEAMAVPG